MFFLLLTNGSHFFTFIFQVDRICSPQENICSAALRKDSFGCRASCTGLNADVSFVKESPAEDTTKDGDIIQDAEVFSQLIQDYRTYKSTFWRNIKFNSTSPTLGTFISCIMFTRYHLCSFQPHQMKLTSTLLRSSLTPQPSTWWSRTRR